MNAGLTLWSHVRAAGKGRGQAGQARPSPTPTEVERTRCRTRASRPHSRTTTARRSGTVARLGQLLARYDLLDHRPHTVNRDDVPSLRERKAQLAQTWQILCEALLHRRGISSHKDVLAQRDSAGDEGPRLAPLCQPLRVCLEQHHYALLANASMIATTSTCTPPPEALRRRRRTNIPTPGRTLDTADLRLTARSCSHGHAPCVQSVVVNSLRGTLQ